MSDPATITADYTLRPGELADTLALLVEACQPAIVWGPPGCAKSQIAQQVAADAGRQYIDVPPCCSTRWTCAASPGAMAMTAPAGRRPARATANPGANAST